MKKRQGQQQGQEYLLQNYRNRDLQHQRRLLELGRRQSRQMNHQLGWPRRIGQLVAFEHRN